MLRMLALLAFPLLVCAQTCGLSQSNQDSCSATIKSYRTAAGKTGAAVTAPGGCPISSMFDTSGACCITVKDCPGYASSGSCSEGKPDKATGYFVTFLAFAIALGGAYYAFGEQAILRMKEDIEYLSKALPADAKAVITEQVDAIKEAATGTVQNIKDETAAAVAEVKETGKAMAKGAVLSLAAAPPALVDKDGGEEEGDDGDSAPAPKRQPSAADMVATATGCADNIKKKMGTDATDLKAGLENMDETLKAKFINSGKNTAAWGLVKLGRFVIAEITILVSLLTPSSCLENLRTTCEEGLWCCGPITMYYFKKWVAYLGIVVNLCIPIYYVTQMHKAKGEQKYFPGSMSNELFKIVTGEPMYRVLPNADSSPDTKNGRVHFGTKYMLGICGYSIGIGVLLQIMTAGVQFYSSACQSDMSGAKEAMTAALVAIVAKGPELVMYYILFLAYIAEAWHIHFTLWKPFPCGPCGCKPFVNRAFDEKDDERTDCFKGRFDTRETPPEFTLTFCNSCCNTRWFEILLYRFYAWFYFAIDDLDKAFHWKVLWGKPEGKHIRIPIKPKLDAFEDEYSRWRLTDLANTIRKGGEEGKEAEEKVRKERIPQADSMERGGDGGTRLVTRLPSFLEPGRDPFDLKNFATSPAAAAAVEGARAAAAAEQASELGTIAPPLPPLPALEFLNPMLRNAQGPGAVTHWKNGTQVSSKQLVPAEKPLNALALAPPSAADI